MKTIEEKFKEWRMTLPSQLENDYALGVFKKGYKLAQKEMKNKLEKMKTFWRENLFGDRKFMGAQDEVALMSLSNAFDIYTKNEELEKKIKEMEERLKEAEKALKFYADEYSWHKDKFLVGSDLMRADLEETNYSRFTPGKRAREYFKKWEMV